MKAMLIACIQGGPFAPERKRHAAGIMQHSEISGVMLGGLGTGECPDLRQELIDASLSEVPQTLLRVLAAGVGPMLTQPLMLAFVICWLVMDLLCFTLAWALACACNLPSPAWLVWET